MDSWKRHQRKQFWYEVRTWTIVAAIGLPIAALIEPKFAQFLRWFAAIDYSTLVIALWP